jgi:ethanolamine transporter EutH
MIKRWLRTKPNFMLLPIAILIAIMILGIYNITTTLISISKKPVSQETKDLNRAIESYVTACWVAKTSKNLASCKIHIDDIENQCKTNVNYSQVIACQDPRLAQMSEEQHQSFTSSQ